MKIKTKSGFECIINENKFADWRYIRAAAEVNSGKEAKILKGITFIVPFILGDEQEEALMDHLKDDDGIVSTIKIVEEFREIETLAGEKVKKSKPSPD